MELQIRGAHQLADLSKRLKAAGDEGKALRKGLYKAIQVASLELKKAPPPVAARTLPRRGGYAGEVAKAKMSTRTRGAGKNVGVRITATGKYVRNADRGLIRGTQPVDPGWFTQTLTAGAPVVRIQIAHAMHAVARAVARG